MGVEEHGFLPGTLLTFALLHPHLGVIFCLGHSVPGGEQVSLGAPKPFLVFTVVLTLPSRPSGPACPLKTKTIRAHYFMFWCGCLLIVICRWAHPWNYILRNENVLILHVLITLAEFNGR